MHNNIVWRVERTRMIIVEQGGCFVRPLRLHVYQAGWFPQGTLSAKNDAVFVVGSTIRHEIAFRTTNLVAREVSRREKFDLGDNNGLVTCCDSIWRWVLYLV